MKRRLSRIFLILPAVLLLLPFLLGMRPPQDRGKPSSSVKIGKGGVRTIISPRNSREYKPGELLVRFKTGIAANRISALHSAIGTATLLESRMISRLQLVKLPKRLSVEAAVTQFRKSGLVVYAEPNWKRYIQGTPYPNDPLVQIQPQALTDPLCDGNADLTGHETDMWNLQMPNQCTSLDPQICVSGYTCGGNNIANVDISALPCTDGDCSVNEPLGAFTDVAQTTTQDVIVMSIDTGVDYTHPDLAPNMWRNPSEVPGNGLDDDQNGIVDDVYGLLAIGLGAEGPGCSNQFGDPMDDHFHGSHTSGTMIARANNFAGLIGMGGLSHRVKVMACKWLAADGGGFTGDAIKCFEYAHDQKVNRGQNVVASNNSWGGGPFSRALEDAIAAHRDAGILTVFSAGNALSDNDVVDTFPTNTDVDNMISVGAYNQHDCASGFSNWGSRSVDIFAPGTLVASACPWNVSNCSGDPNINYAYANGTSMAAPHVTGLVGMLKAVNPSLSSAQIKNIILTTGVLSSNSDATCSTLAPGDDVDNITSSYYYPTFQSFTGDGTEANKKSVTDKRINALRAAQIAASPAGTPGDYNLGAVIWPYTGGKGQEGVASLIKVINVNGQNVGAAGSVTADVTFQSKTTILTESFSGGTLPAGWQNINNGDCTDAWRFDNPAFRDLFDGNFAIADSDFAFLCNMDATLRTPVIDASVCDTAGGETILLDFGNNFNDWALTSEVADVNVTTNAFSSTTNVLSMSGADDVDPKSIDITAAVSSNPATTQVEFKYYNAYYSFWWAIDDVSVSCFDPTVIPCGSGPTAFLDDGVYPDQVAGDGIFALNFTPGSLSGCSGPGTYAVTVNVNGSPLETVTLDVLAGPGGGIPVILPDEDPPIPDLNFAFVPLGTSKSLPIHVRNVGDAAFQITGASKATGINFSFNDFGATYPINVAPGGQVDGIVTFAPTTSGLLSDTLTITTDAGDLFVDMSGTGVGPFPDIHVTPTAINFGTAGSGTVVTTDLTVTNSGTADLHISGFDFPDPNLSTSSTFPLTIPPAGNTTLNVTWIAPSADATLDVQIVIVSDDPDEPAVLIRVLGNSLACSFSDDYSGPVIDPAKWTILSHTFTQTGGDLVGSSLIKRAKIIATGFAGCSNNCSIHTTMSTTGGSGGKFSLIGWYANNRNYAEVRMNEAGDSWQIRHKANGSLKKQTVNATILPGQVYDVVFSFDGTNFTLTVDGGAPLITLSKVAGSNPSGTAGYFVRRTTGNSSFICIQ